MALTLRQQILILKNIQKRIVVCADEEVVEDDILFNDFKNQIKCLEMAIQRVKAEADKEEKEVKNNE